MTTSGPSSPVQPPPPADQHPPRHCGHRREVSAGLLLVLVVAGGLAEARLWRPGIRFDGHANAQIAEAKAWWSDRLDLT